MKELLITVSFKFLEKNYLKILGIIVFFAFLIRLYAADYRAIWWDEIFTWWITQLPLEYSLNVMIGDVHPPFYYIVLSTWGFLVGSSEFLYRLLSNIFSTLSLLYIFKLGCIFNRRTGLFSVVLSSLSWLLVYHTVGIRSYGLLVLLSAMSLFYFLKYTENFENRDGLFYFLSTSFMIFTHFFSLFIVLPQLIYSVKIYLNRSELENLWPLAGLTLSLALIIVYIIKERFYLFLTGHLGIWIEKPVLNDLRDLLVGVTGSLEMTAMYFMLISIAAYFSYKSENLEVRKAFLILFSTLISVILLSWLTSILIFPIFRERFMLPAVFIIYILASYGITKIPDVPIQVIVMTSLVLVAGAFTFNEFNQGQEEDIWPDMVNHIETNTTGDELIVYNGHWIRFGFQKYGEKDMDLISVPENNLYDSQNDYKIDTDNLYVEREDIQKLETQISEFDEVWLILSNKDLETGEEDRTEEITVTLNASHRNYESKSYNSRHDQIKLHKYTSY